jgi:xanthine dehydrogenase accessory factor
MAQDTPLENAVEAALAWHDAGVGAALATVVETWGSAPRPVGSQLAINALGEIVGSVSGGCVEGAVVAEALDIIDAGQGLALLDYGVSDDEAFAVGLACGGRIRIAVEPVAGPDGSAVPALRALAEARAAHRACAYVLETASGARHLAEAGDYPDRFRLDRSGFEPDGTTFVGVHNPPLRMAIIGGVHIAQALVPMARLAGYAVTVIDPREAFASSARFPGTDLSHDWPDAALTALAPDTRTAIVTLTHDPKLDDPALTVALASGAFYIGCLGSTRTHGQRLARLEAAGFDATQRARIHGPVGLDIGARSPGEIAVSIMAELTAVLRRGSAG